MTPIFPELPHTLGAYTLTRLLEMRGETELYAASQGSVGREVALEVLRPGAGPAEQGAFLSTARSRVAADRLPHTGQVLESLCAGGLWFLTQELPQGRSLADSAAGETLRIAELCRIVIAASELFENCAAAGLAALPLTAASIYISPAGKPRFLSPVIAGAAGASPVPYMVSLADTLAPYVPAEVPGTNRMLTLLLWMREGYEGQMLLWEQVRATAQSLMAQLGETEQEEERTTEEGKMRHRRRLQRQWTRRVLYGCGLLLLGGIVASAGLLFRTPQYVTRPAVRAEGISLRLPKGKVLLVAPQPVSVGEYAAFLQRVEAMDADARQQLFSVLSEPPETLVPADWEAQQAHADAPVTGVSFRQALLYAREQGAELPSCAQLQCVFEATGAAGVQEWTFDLFSGEGCGLLRADMPLAVSPELPYAPVPLPHSDYQSSSLGFRIARPQPISE